MDSEKKYYHWIWGENKLRSDAPNYLINLEIGVSIKFDSELAMFSDYDNFYKSLADVQFLYNNRPSSSKVQEILIEAWNYLCLEERKLEDDLDDLNNELF